MTMTKLKNLYHVWQAWYPDDEALESSTLVEADTPSEAAEECCDIQFVNWGRPRNLEVKAVIEVGKVEDAETYEVFVESVPHFSACKKGGSK